MEQAAWCCNSCVLYSCERAVTRTTNQEIKIRRDVMEPEVVFRAICPHVYYLTQA
jgi:hypothetical protein